MINPLGWGLSMGSPSQPSAGTDPLIFPMGAGPVGPGTPWGSSGWEGGICGEIWFPKALLNLFSHVLSYSRHLKNSAKGWGRGMGGIVRERGRSPLRGESVAPRPQRNAVWSP